MPAGRGSLLLPQPPAKNSRRRRWREGGKVKRQAGKQRFDDGASIVLSCYFFLTTAMYTKFHPPRAHFLPFSREEALCKKPLWDFYHLRISDLSLARQANHPSPSSPPIPRL